MANLVEARLPFEPVTLDDLVRAREVMLAYPKAELDFVDCCLAAIGERLNITQICTFDRRDFQFIRPHHILYFDILP